MFSCANFIRPRHPASSSESRPVQAQLSIQNSSSSLSKSVFRSASSTAPGLKYHQDATLLPQPHGGTHRPKSATVSWNCSQPSRIHLPLKNKLPRSSTPMPVNLAKKQYPLPFPAIFQESEANISKPIRFSTPATYSELLHNCCHLLLHNPRTKFLKIQHDWLSRKIHPSTPLRSPIARTTHLQQRPSNG